MDEAAARRAARAVSQLKHAPSFKGTIRIQTGVLGEEGACSACLAGLALQCRSLQLAQIRTLFGERSEAVLLENALDIGGKSGDGFAVELV